MEELTDMAMHVCNTAYCLKIAMDIASMVDIHLLMLGRYRSRSVCGTLRTVSPVPTTMMRSHKGPEIPDS
jgi:hypothetical protein